MPLPYDSRRLRSITDFAQWKRAVEGMLGGLSDRIAALAPADAGIVAAYPYTTAPEGWLRANGQAVLIEDHPNLYDRIGTDFNTGGEGPGEFRVPNYAAPFTGGVWIIRG